MTNKMIVFEASVELMEQGLIKGSGEFMSYVDCEGNEKTVEVPEAIHTFQTWKSLGYSVRKGEHAVAKFPIWKHASKKSVDEETGEEIEKSKMFMKTAAWFSASQVEAIVA